MSLNAFNSDIEREIFFKLLDRDLDGSRLVVQQFCSHLIGSISCNKSIRLRTLELILALSTKLVDMVGEDCIEIVDLNYEHLRQFQEDKEMNSFCQWIEEEVIKAYYDKFETIRINNKNNTIVSKAIKYVEKNYYKNISLAEVARVVYTNPYYLSRLFRKETGFGLKEYLINIRLNVAKNLLTHFYIPISQIAAKVGYEDACYFSRLFREKVGIAPCAYRELFVNKLD